MYQWKSWVTLNNEQIYFTWPTNPVMSMALPQQAKGIQYLQFIILYRKWKWWQLSMIYVFSLGPNHLLSNPKMQAKGHNAITSPPPGHLILPLLRSNDFFKSSKLSLGWGKGWIIKISDCVSLQYQNPIFENGVVWMAFKENKK